MQPYKQVLSDLMINRWTDSTSLSYLYGWNKLQKYLNSIHPFTGQPIREIWCPLQEPLRQLAWLSFLLWLRQPKPAGAQVAHETARKIFVGVNAVYASSGRARIDFKGNYLFCEANRAWKLDTVPSALKTPVTIQDMATILSLANTDPLMVAICVFAWYSMARLSEVFSGTFGDVTELIIVVKIFLPKSKSDTARIGANLFVPSAIWQLIIQLLTVAGVNVFGSGRIFPTTAKTFRSWLKEHLPRVTGHSFRRGMAQHLFDCLVPLDTIKRKARWRSNAWQRYIDTTAQDVTIVTNFASGILPSVNLSHIIFH